LNIKVLKKPSEAQDSSSKGAFITVLGEPCKEFQAPLMRSQDRRKLFVVEAVGTESAEKHEVGVPPKK